MSTHDDVAAEARHDWLDEREPRGTVRPMTQRDLDPFHALDPGYDPPEVCSHGEAQGDCEACTYGSLVDAYDSGLLDV